MSRQRVTLGLESLETRTLLSVRVLASTAFTPLVNQAPDGTGTAMLESNGTVLVQDNGGSNGITNGWFQLTPDSTGSYVNGTWSKVANSGLQRLYYGSNVLPSGQIFVQGGEYSGPYGQQNLTNEGEIYNPVTNTWKTVSTYPQGNYGDDPSEVLPNGNILTGYVFGAQTYIYNPSTDSWSPGGTKLRGDQSDEEAWVKLPDNSILSYDIFASINNNSGSAQRYIPSTNTWVDAGKVPVLLSTPSVGYELGPGFLLNDGRVFYLGANGNTAYYTESTNTWTAGPVIPNGLGCDDAPGAELPNGDILFTADKPLFNGPTSIFEYNPTTQVYTNLTSQLPSSYLSYASFVDRMLVLPNGQVLLGNGSTQLYVFTPSQSAPTNALPTISSITENANGSFLLTGTQINGMNEGAGYGDDAEMSSNYPIVRFTSSSGAVSYARTYNWSSTGVATGSTSESTDFSLPTGLAAGTYKVVVVANGVASTAVSLTIPTNTTDKAPTLSSAAAATPNPVTGTTTSLSVLGADSVGESSLSYSWAATSTPSGVVMPSFSDNGTNSAKNDTVTLTQAGNYTFTVTITNLAGLSVTSSVSVVVKQTLTSVSVTYPNESLPPYPSDVAPNGTLQLTATALDQFGKALSTQPSFAWSISTGTGTVSATGLYKAPATGTLASVTATTSGVSGSQSVWVLTPPFATQDVGGPVAPGAAGDNGQGTYAIQASGSGLYGSSDSFTYAYQAVTGNTLAIIARVASQANTNPYAVAGVMIRNDTSTSSSQSINQYDAMAFMGVTPGAGAVSIDRATASTNSSYAFYSGASAPYWVKLVRSGSTLSGYYSADGVTWTLAQTATISMGSTVDVGLAASNYQDTIYNTSNFDHVTVDTPPTVATAASATPSPVTGTTTTLSALGADLAGESSLTYTWAATTVPAGAPTPTFAANGTNAAKNDGVTFYKAGNYGFTVTITDAAGFTTTSSVAVTVNPTLTSVTLSPSSASVMQGGTQQFSATALDQFGLTLATQPTFTYSVVAGGAGGTISSTGLYTAPVSTFGTDQVKVSSGSASTTANVTVLQVPATIGAVSVDWGLLSSSTLVTASDGLRLLPAGRTTDLPWVGIDQVVINLSKPESLVPSDVAVTGIAVGNYGPVTIAGSGTVYTITLARPINAADRVTVTVANAGVTSYTRRLDVLPGDVNDDGYVTSADVVAANAYLSTEYLFADITGGGTITIDTLKAIRKLNGTFLPPI